jgi:hypothetical protein
MELTSGFVVAVLLASILLMDRIGGQDEWARRIFQFALGAALAIAVVTTVTAFVIGDAARDQGFGNGDSDIVNRLVIGSGLTLACGFVALLAGASKARDWSTIPSGMILGGLFLIAIGGIGAYTGFVSYSSEASFVARCILVAVSIGGFLMLFAFGYDQYERLTIERESDEDPGERTSEA